MGTKLNRAMEFIGWRIPKEDYEQDFDFDAYEEELVATEDPKFSFTPAVKPAPEVTKPAVNTKKPPLKDNKILTINPKSFEDARQIGEEFRNNSSIIINLGSLSNDCSRRIIDFAAGLAFALRGKIDKITDKVFLLTPNNVSVFNSNSYQVDSSY